MAWTSDAFEPRNVSETIFQRSVKTSEEEAWQTPDDTDNNYSTIPNRELIYINLRDISATEELESMCHDSVGWKARCSPRAVTTESVSV